MRLIVLLTLTVAACAPRRAPAPANAATTLITNALLIDGSGSAARPGGVRIAGDRIVEVGTLRAQPGERVVDAGGLVARIPAGDTLRLAPTVRDTFVGGGVVMKFRRAGGRITGALLHSGRVRNIVFSRVRER
jgi:hypothetical protein